MEDDRGWPWNVPTEEFFSLGDDKMKMLRYFIWKTGGFNLNGKPAKPEEVIKAIEGNRQFASKVYIAFKASIEHLMATDPFPLFNKSTEPEWTSYKPEKKATKAPQKPKAKKKTKTKGKPKGKAKSKPMGQIIDFTAYKQKRSMTS